MILKRFLQSTLNAIAWAIVFSIAGAINITKFHADNTEQKKFGLNSRENVCACAAYCSFREVKK